MVAFRIASLFVLIAALTACTRVQTGGTPSGSHTLNIGAAVAPNSFNPLLNTEQVETMVDRFVYDPLVVTDNTGAQRPDLAVQVPSQQNGGISRDGRTITYKLRHDVKWHDGVPFTSEDVAFSFHATMNPKNNISTRTGYDLVDRVTTPDRYTVVFHLRRPYAPIVTTLFSSGVGPAFVVPAHLLRSYSVLNSVPFNANPIGTGPYRMVRWMRGDHIEFQANPNYFMGKPKIATIILRFIPDENTMVNQLRTHEIDWFFSASESSYNELKAVPGVRIVISPQNSERGMLINTESPLVRDRRVRQAIAYAIDKEAIVQKATYGAAHAATEDLPSFMWAYDPHVRRYLYDPARAKQLLAEAGWKPGPDGILAKNGQRMQLELVLRQGAATDTAMSVLVQSYLKAAGIEVSIKTYQGSMLFAGGTSGILSGGRYDIDLSGFESGTDPDNSAQFICSARPPNGFNWTRYCNPEMDAAQEQALGSYDRGVRKAAYAKIEGLLARDVPQIFFYWQPQIDAVNPALKHFTGGPFTSNWNVYQWEL
ncbi:MAG: peptide ABC transporter substrate-binding protein [Candidatus Eremiobacteraeota bacterium]|nr:peptide ABC transporter substrate-binding protein [Candidatus Eremiobacteraeota bacterium]